MKGEKVEQQVRFNSHLAEGLADHQGDFQFPIQLAQGKNFKAVLLR